MNVYNVSMKNNITASKYFALRKQTNELSRVKDVEPSIKDCAGMKILVLPKVYATSIDTELMIETVEISSNETFLEIGCGAGAVAISLAKRSKTGLAVDINQEAVKNTIENAEAIGASNLTVKKSNVFEKVDGKFDVIVCNPPYSQNEVSDDFERMFWDPNNEMKKVFFKEAKEYLSPNGKIYFGWADFADIDVNLPSKFADEYGYKIVNIISKSSTSGEFNFYVFELKPV